MSALLFTGIALGWLGLGLTLACVSGAIVRMTQGPAPQVTPSRAAGHTPPADAPPPPLEWHTWACVGIGSLFLLGICASWW